MRAAMIVMVALAWASVVGAAAPEWTPGKPVPAGPLVERPVVVAVLIRHDRPAAEASAALAEIAKARFPEITVVKEVPKTPAAGPLAHGAALEAAQQPLPTGPALDYTARRLEPAERTALAATKGALVLSFLVDPARRTDLASVCALAHAVAEKLAGFMEDGESRDVFTRAQWKAARLDSWQGVIAAAAGHVAVQPWKRGDKTGIEVLGMRRFGLPDLALDGIGEADASAAAALMMYVAQALIERPVADAGAVTVKAVSLQHAKMRSPRGAAAGVPVKLVVQTPPEAKGNPRRLLLAPEPSETAAALVTRLLKALAGDAPEVAMPQHQLAALEAASARAQTRIRELAKLYQTKPPADAALLVKAPFPTTSGGREWMWVEVTRWEPGQITGKLKNAPSDVASMAEGQTVTIPDAELFDYLYTAAGQPPEGGQTDRVIDPGGDE